MIITTQHDGVGDYCIDRHFFACDIIVDRIWPLEKDGRRQHTAFTFSDEASEGSFACMVDGLNHILTPDARLDDHPMQGRLYRVGTYFRLIDMMKRAPKDAEGFTHITVSRYDFELGL